MSDDPEATAVQTLLVDGFTRVHELVDALTDGLEARVATFRPDPQANTIAWLVWHLSRIQDDHVAALAGVEQVWPQWRDRFALPFDDDETGYAQSPDDVEQVHPDAALLNGYHRDVHALTLHYVTAVDAAELGRVVDTRWDPPVTASTRLVSVLGDTLQHLGQAAYVQGLAERHFEEA